MDNSGFLKTVSFGGFDKKDVLAYVDDLNTKIYTLEAELEETKLKIGQGGDSANLAGDKEYEELLAKERAKVNELMANNDTLKLSVQSYEDVIKEKDAEIERLKEQLANAEANQGAAPEAAETNSDAENLGDYFVQAKMLADKMVTDAKVFAKKINEDAKELADQVIDEANDKASGIVNAANDKAEKIVSDAEQQTESIHIAASEAKVMVQAEIREFSDKITKLNDIIAEFSMESTDSLDKAKTVISDVEEALEKGEPIKTNYTYVPEVKADYQEEVVEEPKQEFDFDFNADVEEAAPVEEAPVIQSAEDILSQFAINPEAEEAEEAAPAEDDQKNIMDLAAMEQFVNSISADNQVEEEIPADDSIDSIPSGPIQLEDMM